METYIINGVEVEYDTFDLVNMEIYRDEVRRVAELSELSKDVTVDNYVEIVREMCECVMDAFDTIIGEGTSQLLFGGRVNAKTVPQAWSDFTRAVSANLSAVNANSAGAPIPMNREQRRKAERERRREEARKRVAARTNDAG